MKNYVELLHQAQRQIKASPLWKRFIDGTPLSNDIAVWMADFAQEYRIESADSAPYEQIAALTAENAALKESGNALFVRAGKLEAENAALQKALERPKVVLNCPTCGFDHQGECRER